MTQYSNFTELAAGNGVAVRLNAGRRLKIVNTHGTQVVDTWAVMAGDPSEHMSMEHTRRMTGHLHPVVGDKFWSNRRNPMLVLEEDTFPGTHDTIVACCDRWLYEHYGCASGHANCRDNYVAALEEAAIQADVVPNPLNLWMNVPVDGNSVTITEPLSRPGDCVTLRAECDVVVVFFRLSDGRCAGRQGGGDQRGRLRTETCTLRIRLRSAYRPRRLLDRTRSNEMHAPAAAKACFVRRRRERSRRRCGTGSALSGGKNRKRLALAETTGFASTFRRGREDPRPRGMQGRAEPFGGLENSLSGFRGRVQGRRQKRVRDRLGSEDETGWAASTRRLRGAKSAPPDPRPKTPRRAALHRRLSPI